MNKKGYEKYGAFKLHFPSSHPPKKASSSFEDFQPISCCNLIYKLIANCPKPIFSGFISEEKYGFVFNRQIHYVVSITQEVIHSVNLKKIPSFVMYLNFSKDYDEVNWTFIRIALIQLGMDLELVN